jgi:hypothetical protein
MDMFTGNGNETIIGIDCWSLTNYLINKYNLKYMESIMKKINNWLEIKRISITS